jgi:hypothetical protein
MSPQCERAMSRAIARPSPVPLVRADTGFVSRVFV